MVQTPQWSTPDTGRVVPRSTAQRKRHTQDEVCSFFVRTPTGSHSLQTPIWQQPPPGLAAGPATTADVPEVLQVDAPIIPPANLPTDLPTDPPTHPPVDLPVIPPVNLAIITQNPPVNPPAGPQNLPANPPTGLQNGELLWPLPTRLVHPTRGGKWSLLAQNNDVKAVVQGAITRTLQYIVFTDSFPSGEQKVRMQRDSLYRAADDDGHDDIARRLTRDRNYGRWLSTLVCGPIIFAVHPHSHDSLDRHTG